MSRSEVETKELGEVIESMATGKTPSTKVPEYFEREVDWFTPGDIGVCKDLMTSNRFISKKAIEDKKAILFPRDTLLITCIGDIGRVGVLQKPSSSNQQITGIKFKSNVDINYAYYWFIHNSKTLQHKANNAVVPILNNGTLRQIPFTYPALKTQQKIAGILAQADAARQKRKQANQLTEQFLQSAFLEMFGDPVRNEKGWEVKELKDVVRKDDKVNYGVVQPGDDVTNGVPLIRVGDFMGMKISKENMKRISPDIDSQYKRSRIIGDEILLACVGSIGKVALADETLNGFNTVRAVARIRCSALLNRLYLAYYLSTPFIQNYFVNQTRTVSQPTLNIKQIEETKIILPSLPLQQKFAVLVEQVERLRTKQRESERELENLFQSLMQKYFG